MMQYPGLVIIGYCMWGIALYRSSDGFILVMVAIQ
jgi:hypothetical protein